VVRVFFKDRFYTIAAWQKVAAVLCLLGAAISGNVFAQEVPAPTVPQVAEFDTWNKVCVAPPGTPTQRCELVQNTVGKNRPDIVMRVSFIKIPQNDKTPDKGGALLRIKTPIRVELPLGVSIIVENDKNLGNMPYQRCSGDNCYAEAFVNEDLMQLFLEGKTVTIIVYPSQEEGVGSVINLAGFKAAYKALP